MQRLLLMLAVLPALACAQTHSSVRHSQEQVIDQQAVAEFNQAQDAIEKQDFATARKLLQQYTSKAPSDARGWYTLGYAESAAGDKAAAISDYRKAATINPQFFEANLNLGLLLAQAGDKDAAIQALTKATQEQPSSSDAAKAKSRAYEALGHLLTGDEAKHALQQAIALDPANDGAKQALQSPAPSAQTSAPLSTEQLEQAHGKDPNDAAVSSQLAHHYIEAKQYVKAEPLLRQLAAANTNDADAQYRYGFVLMHMNRAQQALPFLAKAINLNPDLKEAYGDLAVAAAQAKNYPLSQKALDARAKFEPENSGTYFLRATNLDHLQQVKAAAIMYRKFLASSHGEFPDREWQAKHRLIALDPNNETKGKE
jgi:tetratricopeptide (TPR) repeat protein